MSGARGPIPAPRSSSPAWGSAFWEPSRALPRLVLNPRPATIANSARKASAATIHGSAFVLGSWGTALVDPTAEPQRWQNFAPGLSVAEHAAHLAPASGAPQFAQYWPVPGVPQDLQVVGESDEGDNGICSSYSGNLIYALRDLPE